MSDLSAETFIEASNDNIDLTNNFLQNELETLESQSICLNQEKFLERSYFAITSTLNTDVTSGINYCVNILNLESDNGNKPSISSSPTIRGVLLPWGSTQPKESMTRANDNQQQQQQQHRPPGEFVMRTLFSEFTIQAAKKIENVILNESPEKPLPKHLQRGEDPNFDRLLSALGSVAEHCLPSLLRALFAWYERQMTVSTETTVPATNEQKQIIGTGSSSVGAIAVPSVVDQKTKSIMSIVSSSASSLGGGSGNAGGSGTTGTEINERSETVAAADLQLLQEKRDLAVEFIFCLCLIEILKQLHLHPGHEDLVNFIENLAFRHFKYRDGVQIGRNAGNVHLIADLYAEVIGVLAQSRFSSVRKRFLLELKELRTKEANPQNTQSVISLLMGMKFFRVKMVPIEEFEASFQFMQEAAQYFLEVKDKDIKHALAGLFVEILVPVAATVKNEVNVPCLKNFVEMLYSQTLDASTKSKHRLALFPLVTCLLCVSQKTFFLQNWHYFLAMCLSHLKNRDPKMSRVALESLYRLLWVYMIRIKCESNSATQSRLQSIVNSLFPKGSKSVVPRDTPLNIFVKIIQFIAQERLDFAMREIVFDLLSVGRSFKIILTPERMSIGLRAFLVVADSLQQKEGEPPMPRTVGVLPSGNTLRVRKTFLNKMLTEDAARTIGISSYYPHVRRVFVDILRALDANYGRPLMMTNTQNVNKEPDEMITGDRKPRIDLFRTCVAAVPRLIPDAMSRTELIDLLSRLTLHMDEELRVLAFQSLQTLVVDFADWRPEVVKGFTQFLATNVHDVFPQLVDNGLRMLVQLLNAWKGSFNGTAKAKDDPTLLRKSTITSTMSTTEQQQLQQIQVLRYVEAFALVMLCNCRLATRRLAIHILKDTKVLYSKIADYSNNTDDALLTVFDRCCIQVLEKNISYMPPSEKVPLLTSTPVDLHFLCERTANVSATGNDAIDTSSTLTGGTNSNSGLNLDVWTRCLMGLLMEKDSAMSKCPQVISYAWTIVVARINQLFTVVDPTPVSDNRASLLRSSTPARRCPPTAAAANERDAHVRTWRLYAAFACRVAPSSSLVSTTTVVNVNVMTSSSTTSTNVRCASPDLSLSSSPDSLTTISSTTDSTKTTTTSQLFKLFVPLLRCETADVRDAVVYALGMINPDAVKDLMEDLTPTIRDAIDRKQENVRRRRRRDALRLQLVRVFELMAETGALRGAPTTTIVEFIDGVRLSLEAEGDKREIVVCYGGFITKLAKNMTPEFLQNILKRDLRRNLFNLFTTFSGSFGLVPNDNVQDNELVTYQARSTLQMAALQAMSALLTAGPCFDPQNLAEDGIFYQWLDLLLASQEEKVCQLARDTIVLLLENNPDIGPLLDWVIDRCYTAPPSIADSCFFALSTIFSAREYPCDHYTAVINVTLMNTGCSRPNVRDTALQLLQLLDKRFFGTVPTLPATEEDINTVQQTKPIGTLDALLETTYCRSQIFLSRQLAQLHPELTMPMFSEITYRFQTARPAVRQLLLQYLLPWLYNMELVDPNVPHSNTNGFYQFYGNEPMVTVRKDGWGSVEATEMTLNNIFYITAKFGNEHQKEIEEVWSTLCSSWSNNLKIILRYLIIVSGMAPQELLPYTKRVTVFLARTAPTRLLNELITELQTIETLNYLIERTETPPFYRLTSMRKTSSQAEATGGGNGAITYGVSGSGGGMEQSGNGSGGDDTEKEKGFIHTKRHSAEDGRNSFQDKNRSKGTVHLSEDTTTPSMEQEIDFFGSQPTSCGDKSNILFSQQPHPLPMPEFGGYFAPLTEYLPDSSIPISSFHRCNIAVMLLTDIVTDGIEFDWSIHLPLILHVIFLGLDHTRPLVHEHCKQLLLNLLIVVGNHGDQLSVAQLLLNHKTEKIGLGLVGPQLPIISHNFTETDSIFDSCVSTQQQKNSSNAEGSVPSVIITPDENSSEKLISDVSKSLINFLCSKESLQLWPYEDITAKIWSIKSFDQMRIFLQHVLRIFQLSFPTVANRWAQISLQFGLSCSSRHYAGRSLQIFRCLNISINNQMLSDILSRLVETVADQGEDMQGYVTEILLTLQNVVDSLESDFKPLDFMKEIFKSTPNLNNKEPPKVITKGVNFDIYSGIYQGQTHTRSTSYSVSYCLKKGNNSTVESKEGKGKNELEGKSGTNRYSSPLSRSRSAQSLKLLSDGATQDDKLTILAQLFWLSVSLLESDFEHEFLLALKLLDRVLNRMPLQRPDARDKVEKLQSQLRWSNFLGVHAMLLKGCTHPNIYESVIPLLSQFTLLLDLPFVDPSQSLAFPMNVIALLPYLLLNYEDTNEICIRSAENIAQVSTEKSKKLENLATVMTLYSRRNFSKESFQWTKCVIKYLYDTYSHLSMQMLAFLVEILEKGPPVMQLPVLNIIHCILHYIDLSAVSMQPVILDLLRVVAKYLEGTLWKESLKILKLVVTRSSTLVAPSALTSQHQQQQLPVHPLTLGFETDISGKKELPGRTLEFTFDLSQTPLIGRRFLSQKKTGNLNKFIEGSVSPRRSCSLSPGDVSVCSGWKRPWLSQGKVRECLVNLLTTCGQKVGLPKSPSVIFSQSSDMIDHQSSMASSTEEMSTGPGNDASLDSGNRNLDAATAAEQFGVFRDFDFLEYESESVEGESTDNFNWGVRRRPLSDGDQEVSLKTQEESCSEQSSLLLKNKRSTLPEESSDDEIGSESPLDEIPIAPDFDTSSGAPSSTSQIDSTEVTPRRSTSEDENLRRRRTGDRRASSSSGSSACDLGDVTPCNTSPNISSLLTSFRPIVRNDADELWRHKLQSGFSSSLNLELFQHLLSVVKDIGSKTITLTRDCYPLLSQCNTTPSPLVSQLSNHLSLTADLLFSKTIEPTHFIYFPSTAFCSSQICENFQFGILEIQEHLETFCDRKEHVIECMDAVKTALKLQLLGESQNSDFISDELLLDLGKALYKLHFQLFLFIEATNKMMSRLVNILHNSQLKDVTKDVQSIKKHIQAVDDWQQTCEDEKMDESLIKLLHTNNDELETKLFELIQLEQWSTIHLFLKQHREIWELDNESLLGNILNLYCKKSSAINDCFCFLYNETDAVDLYTKLFRISSYIIDIEKNIKERDQTTIISSTSVVGETKI